MNNLLKILLLTAPLVLTSQCTPDNRTIELVQQPKREIIIPEYSIDFNYPFTTIQEKPILPDSMKPDEKAKIFLENTLTQAENILFEEKRVKSKHQETIQIFKDKRQLLNAKELQEQINKENEFYKEIQRFGRGILEEDKLTYNKELGNRLLKLGTKPTDCITYVLESMGLGNSRNYNQEKYADSRGLAELLKKLNFEAVYIAENTTKTSKEYRYNAHIGIPSFTKDFLEKIKQDKYLTKIDYLIINEDFHNPLFKKFLKQNKGFLIIQEGSHTGFLSNRDLLECHKGVDPIKEDLYSKTDLFRRMDNTIPLANYQSAILFVPKGTVQNFWYNNNLTSLIKK